MRTSAAAIVQEYLQRYVYISLLKTKKNKNIDPYTARILLASAYNIIHEMEYLEFSNNANNFEHIKNYVKDQVGVIHSELKKQHSYLRRYFVKTTLPSDFEKCVYEAWFRLQYFEKEYNQSCQQRLASRYPRD